jgi:hypothetical protein
MILFKSRVAGMRERACNAPDTQLLCQKHENENLYQPSDKLFSHQNRKKDMKLVELH